MVSGTWTVADSALSGEASSSRGVILAPEGLTDGRISVQLACQAWSGHATNGVVIFDYQDAANYRYAQLLCGWQRWALGQVTNGSAATVTQSVQMAIATGAPYTMVLLLDAGAAGIEVDGATVAAYDYGAPFGSERVGLVVDNAHTHFDNWETETLSPTARHLEDFGCQPHAVKQAGQDRFGYDGGNMAAAGGGERDAGDDVHAAVRHREPAGGGDRRTRTSGPAQVTRLCTMEMGSASRRWSRAGARCLYVGELYEVRVSGQQVLTRTSYYYHGGVRVALRVTNGSSALDYLHTDHLGSSTLATCGNSTGGCPPAFAYKAPVAKRLYRRVRGGALHLGHVANGLEGASGLGQAVVQRVGLC